jgi:uncharacterized protein YecE (DUF72 family)
MQQLFIGTSGYSYKHWNEVFYPGEVKKKDWFMYYAQCFNSVEINATFYRSFKEKTYKKWYDQAPAHFKYVLKVPRLITHRKFLKDSASSIKRFYDSATLLKEKLGVMLMQLPPKFPYDIDRLYNAINEFPDPDKLVIEFRDMKWFNKEVFQLLSENNVSICDFDSQLKKNEGLTTSDTLYMRFHGREEGYKYNYSPNKLGHVRKRIEDAKSIKQAYVFFNNDFRGYAPNNALKLKELIQS